LSDHRVGCECGDGSHEEQWFQEDGFHAVID
jgi:hypothetical protein